MAKIYFAEDDIEETIFHLNASAEFKDHKIDAMIELSDLYVAKSNFSLAKNIVKIPVFTRESIEDLTQYASTLVDQSKFLKLENSTKKLRREKKTYPNYIFFCM